jgi:hypothetical protein
MDWQGDLVNETCSGIQTAEESTGDSDSFDCLWRWIIFTRMVFVANGKTN